MEYKKDISVAEPPRRTDRQDDHGGGEDALCDLRRPDCPCCRRNSFGNRQLRLCGVQSKAETID